jgi:hypothetical protein
MRIESGDNTVESFSNAKDVLSPDGTLVLSFATGRNFATDRLYKSVAKAFGVEPAAYFTRYWVNGVLLVEGQGRTTIIPELFNAGPELQAKQDVILATDHWQNRSIPTSILVVSALCLLAAWALLRRLGLGRGMTNSFSYHFFLLGAGFLLLETKGVTQMSLLFGSTWLVDAVIIRSFLVMAIASNAVAAYFDISKVVTYGLLLFVLVADFWFPYSLLNGTSSWVKILVGGGWVALPVFFSGMIFSSSFKRQSRAAEALGANLFGAVVGGILEISIMEKLRSWAFWR